MSWKAYRLLLRRFLLPVSRITYLCADGYVRFGLPPGRAYAGKPHTRPCEGKSQMIELLDHDPGASVLAFSSAAIDYPAARSPEKSSEQTQEHVLSLCPSQCPVLRSRRPGLCFF